MGPAWRGQTVLARCDNAAVVATINKGPSRNKEAMHLARCLAFILAEHEIRLTASHIKGAENTMADALSRNDLVKFCVLCSQAAAEPSVIPDTLLDLLLVKRPDWTCTNWTELWKNFVKGA